jgi:hypothetical protein
MYYLNIIDIIENTFFQSDYIYLFLSVYKQFDGAL